MSLEKLLAKIITDAEAEAEAILTDARAEVARMERESAAKAEELRLEQLEEARRSAEKERMRVLSNARISARMRILAVKRELLDEVAKTAGQRIEQLSDAEFHAWFKGLLLANAQSGREELRPAKVDRQRFSGKLLSEVNQELRKLGLEGKLEISPVDASVIRGCVLREGEVETILGVEILVKKAFEEREDELARILFKEPV